jgi:predicted nucleic acid-binding protein
MAVDRTMAERAAQLRVACELKTPDAIHLATAITAGASHFVTNDSELGRFPYVKVLCVDDIPHPR